MSTLELALLICSLVLLFYIRILYNSCLWSPIEYSQIFGKAKYYDKNKKFLVMVAEKTFYSRIQCFNYQKGSPLAQPIDRQYTQIKCIQTRHENQ
jgi:Iap family predicted aminopeptidase